MKTSRVENGAKLYPATGLQVDLYLAAGVTGRLDLDTVETPQPTDQESIMQATQTADQFFANLRPVARLMPAESAEMLCRQSTFTDWLFVAQWPAWKAAARTIEGASELEVARATVARLCGVACISELRDAVQFRATVYAPFMSHQAMH
ncbi:MAG: hypothetical protein J0L58_10130 [Burkholderiales bacterium]|nr:hypothetical protein [Burkholderiales bacterium]